MTNDSIWAKQQLIAISQLRCETKQDWEYPRMTVTNLSKKKEDAIIFSEEPILTSVIECNGQLGLICLFRTHRIYTRAYINGSSFIGLVDTAAPKDCREINKTYYDINKGNLLRNGLQEKNIKDIRGMARIISSLKYRPILNPEVTFAILKQ